MEGVGAGEECYGVGEGAAVEVGVGGWEGGLRGYGALGELWEPGKKGGFAA